MKFDRRSACYVLQNFARSSTYQSQRRTHAQRNFFFRKTSNRKRKLLSKQISHRAKNRKNQTGHAMKKSCLKLFNNTVKLKKLSKQSSTCMNEWTNEQKICQHVANAVTQRNYIVGLQWEKEMESATETVSRSVQIPMRDKRMRQRQNE